MFIGHFGVGFGAKAAMPRASLGTLFFAAQLADLIWPTLLLAGIEKVAIQPGITKVTPLDFTHYPITHSLAGIALLGVAFALLYRLAGGKAGKPHILAMLVVSHWVLDLFVHRPDLELIPGLGAKLGFSLWNSLPATLLIELPLFFGGLWLYSSGTKAKDRTGGWALWSLAVFLLIVYAGNIFGPPPPDAASIAWVGQAQWLLVLWGYWVDSHRFVISKGN